MNDSEREAIQEQIDLLRRAEEVGRSLKPAKIKHPRLLKKRRMARITEDLEISGRQMRWSQAVIGSMAADIEKLPTPFDQLLSAAANEMLSCVTLASYSMKRCDAASEYLDEAEELLSAIG